MIRSLAEKAHVSIEGANIIDPMLVLRDEPTEWGDEMVNGLYEARKKKGKQHTKQKAQMHRHSDSITPGLRPSSPSLHTQA